MGPPFGAPALEVRYHGPRGSPPSDNLYVRGFPPMISQPEVERLFSHFGNVTSMRVMPGYGDSPAVALVRLASEAEATTAVMELDGMPLPIAMSMIEGGFKGGKGKGPPPPFHPQARPPPAAWGPPFPPAGGTLHVRFHAKPGVPPEPSNNLYVKGLPPPSTEQDVISLFQNFGTVVQMKVMPGATDTCALVRMASIEEAHVAIQSLDGASSAGLEAPPPVPPIEVRFHGPKGSPPSDNLYVKGLPMDADHGFIRHVFGPYGTVTDMRIMPPNGLGRDATALVRMASVEEATAALHGINAIGRHGSEYAPMGAPSRPQAHGGSPYWSDSTPSWPSQPGKGKGKYMPAGPSTPRPLSLEVRFHGPKGSPPGDNLYVKGLPKNVSREEIIELFSSCGTVVDMRIMSSKGDAPDAAALVRMASVEEATVAVEIFGSSGGGGGGEENLAAGPVLGALSPGTAAHLGKGPAMSAGKGKFVAPPSKADATLECPLEVRYHGPPTGAPPSDNLYVKGLPPSANEDQVHQIFSQYGTVTDMRIMRGKGNTMGDLTALVRMGSVEEATTAIAAINGQMVQFPAQAGEAWQSSAGPGYGSAPPAWQPMQTQPPQMEVRFHGPPRGAPPSDNLYVKGLAGDMPEQALVELFSAYGAVQSVRIMRPKPGIPDATALVRMGSVEEAQNAIDNLNPAGVPSGGSNGQYRSAPY